MKSLNRFHLFNDYRELIAAAWIRFVAFCKGEKFFLCMYEATSRGTPKRNLRAVACKSLMFLIISFINYGEAILNWHVEAGRINVVSLCV